MFFSISRSHEAIQGRRQKCLQVLHTRFIYITAAKASSMKISIGLLSLRGYWQSPAVVAWIFGLGYSHYDKMWRCLDPDNSHPYPSSPALSVSEDHAFWWKVVKDKSWSWKLRRGTRKCRALLTKEVQRWLKVCWKENPGLEVRRWHRRTWSQKSLGALVWQEAGCVTRRLCWEMRMGTCAFERGQLRKGMGETWLWAMEQAAGNKGEWKRSPERRD